VSETLRRVQEQAAGERVRISEHGYDELTADGILTMDVIAGVGSAATKLVREGSYAAEVEVDLIGADGPWAPYLSLSDVRKLDDVRMALRRGDVAVALRWAKVYCLTPITGA